MIVIKFLFLKAQSFGVTDVFEYILQETEK